MKAGTLENKYKQTAWKSAIIHHVSHLSLYTMTCKIYFQPKPTFMAEISNNVEIPVFSWWGLKHSSSYQPQRFSSPSRKVGFDLWTPAANSLCTEQLCDAFDQAVWNVPFPASSTKTSAVSHLLMIRRSLYLSLWRAVFEPKLLACITSGVNQGVGCPASQGFCCQTLLCESKTLLHGGHSLGGNLPPLDMVYLKKYGCSDARYSAYQLSAHIPLPLLPPLSSFALQSSKEKAGRERTTPFFLCVFSTSYTLERFYYVPSVNSAGLIVRGSLLTLIHSVSSRLPSWVQRKFLLVC